MVSVEMVLEKKGANLLQFVKVIKDCTGLGLKESKDIADSFRDSKITIYKIDVNSRKKFQYLLDTETDWSFKIIDRKAHRLNRLLELGLGDISDKIDIISEELSHEIISRLNTSPIMRSHSANYLTYNEFFADLISKLDPEQIEKLYKERNKKSETN